MQAISQSKSKWRRYHCRRDSRAKHVYQEKKDYLLETLQTDHYPQANRTSDSPWKRVTVRVIVITYNSIVYYGENRFHLGVQPMKDNPTLTGSTGQWTCCPMECSCSPRTHPQNNLRICALKRLKSFSNDTTKEFQMLLTHSSRKSMFFFQQMDDTRGMGSESRWPAGLITVLKWGKGAWVL